MNTLLTMTGLALLGGHAGEESHEYPLTQPVPARPVEAAVPDEPQADNELIWSWKNGLRFQNADGSLKFKMGGRIYYDMSWIGNEDGLDAAGISTEDGTEFRTARLYVAGEFYDDFFFKAQYDFAGVVDQEDTVAGTPATVDFDDKRPLFKDVFMGRKDVLGTADVKVGHFKEPFGLGQLTSSRYTTFMERALPTSNDRGRNAGIMVYDTAMDESMTWAIGGFRGTDDAGFDTDDGAYALTARVTGVPFYENEGESLIHVGAAYSTRSTDEVRFAARPETHNTNAWVDTGTLAADGADLLIVELGGVFGPLHMQAEYIMAGVDGDAGVDDPDFDSWYVQAGYFITGESRNYNRTKATFDRTSPNRNWDKQGGKGAWEVAARYSTLDLDDSGITGGEITDITLGINWYMNPNMRLMLNYIMPDVENDATGLDEDTDIISIRFQVDW